MPTLRLKHNEDRRLRAGHLWVFSNEIDVTATPLTDFAPGALCRVLSDRDQFLGYAYVNPATLVAARIVSREASRPVDAKLLTARLESALALRSRVAAGPYYRWVYGDADGLPGLVLDRFGDLVVGQIATVGIERLRPDIEAAVRRVLGPAALVWKNDSGARALEQLPDSVEAAWGTLPADLEIEEVMASGRALKFRAPLAAGQKTGWYYDQTANRAALARFLPPRARVLDVCSYAGAWAIAAQEQGAATATCIDASGAALKYAQANAARNGFSIEAIEANAFQALEALASRSARFDVVILDPPAFIKRKKDIAQGEAAYRKLNQLALALVADDGLLVSCSCSYHLSQDALLGAVQGAARRTGRFVQVLHFGGQSPDHPVHPAIPETRYLKALFCRVTRE